MSVETKFRHDVPLFIRFSVSTLLKTLWYRLFLQSLFTNVVAKLDPNIIKADYRRS